ncbi:MAG: hypothetical protein KDJ18_06905 [Hyphomicrobiaceae bacterium]|nr:hypothetical protein [Hyphomicrobiaceae bacterium]
MSQSTLMLGRSVPAEREPSRLLKVLSVLGQRFAASQQARADRMVRPYLARMPETDLKALGFSATEITQLRKERHLPVVRWV